jgi:hypothetical protein
MLGRPDSSRKGPQGVDMRLVELPQSPGQPSPVTLRFRTVRADDPVDHPDPDLSRRSAKREGGPSDCSAGLPGRSSRASHASEGRSNYGLVIWPLQDRTPSGGGRCRTTGRLRADEGILGMIGRVSWECTRCLRAGTRLAEPPQKSLVAGCNRFPEWRDRWTLEAVRAE